jgi:hypothetical protein
LLVAAALTTGVGAWTALKASTPVTTGGAARSADCCQHPTCPPGCSEECRADCLTVKATGKAEKACPPCPFCP